MKRGFPFILLVLFTAAKLFAQCETCPTVAGEVIDHCFCEADFPKRCVQFTEDAKTFYYQDLNRKKGNPMKFELPPNMEVASTSYLLGLASNKKLKLGAADLLVIAKGLEEWRQLEGIRKWNSLIVNSGYTLTASGLGYKPIIVGDGQLPEEKQGVTVHYTGYLSTGEKFDSSVDRNKAFEFVLGMGKVIKGWDEGIALMTIGSRYMLRIPPHLGYGSRGFGNVIPANAILYFDVRLIAAG